MSFYQTSNFKVYTVLLAFIWIGARILIPPSFAGENKLPPGTKIIRRADDQFVIKIPKGAKLSPKVLKALQEANEEGGGIPNHKQSSAIYWRGRALLTANRYESAIPIFTQFIETYKSESLHLKKEDKVMHDYYLAWGFQNRGYCYLELRGYAEGIKNLSEAIKLRPHYAANYTNRAKAYRLLGKDKLAQDDLNKARLLPKPTGEVATDLENEFVPITKKAD